MEHVKTRMRSGILSLATLGEQGGRNQIEEDGTEAKQETVDCGER